MNPNRLRTSLAAVGLSAFCFLLSALPVHAVTFTNNARVEISDPAGSLSRTSGGSDLTVMCWFKFSIPTGVKITSDMVILANRTNGTTSDLHAYNIYYNASSGSVDFTAKGSSLYRQTLIAKPYIDRWYHVAVAMSAANYYAYVDGRSPQTIGASVGNTSVTNGVSIGGWGSGKGLWGEVQEVAIYRMFLNAGNIQTRMFKDLRNPLYTNSLVGYYRLGASTNSADWLKNFAPGPAAGTDPASALPNLASLAFEETDQSGEQSLYDSRKNGGVDAIVPLSGAFAWSQSALTRPTPGIAFQFNYGYSSALPPDGGSGDDYDNRTMGGGWRHTFDARLVKGESSTVLNLLTWDGATEVWDRLTNSTTTYATRHKEYRGELVKLTDGTDDHEWTTPDRLVFRFRNPDAGDANTDGRLLEIRDYSSNRVQISWDEGLGRVSSVTDTAGARYDFNYNDAQLLTNVSSQGWSVNFAYDLANRRLTSKSLSNASGLYSPVSTTWQFFYSTNGLLERILDPRGNTNLFVRYDSYGRKTNEVDALSRTNFTSYGTPGKRQITRTDPGGFQWVETYDRKGRVVARQDALTNITTFAYDERGNRTRITEPLGYTTYFAYDGRANLTNRIDALNQVTAWVIHTNFNKPIQKITPQPLDVNGQPWWTNFYVLNNTNGNLLRHYDAIGTLVSYTYTTNGLVASATDGNNRVTRFTYDANGFLIAQTDPATNTWSFTRNELGWKLTAADPLGETTEYTYDLNGNVVQVLDPLWRTFTRRFDGNGNLIAVSDAKGEFTYHGYDAANQRVVTTNRDGSLIGYTYTSRGKVERVFDPLGFASTNSYDRANRLVAVADPRGTTVTNIYDANGNLVTTLDKLNQPWSKTYDKLNRVVAETDPLGDTKRTTYDVAGRAQTNTVPKGYPSTHNYDGRGRLIRWVDAENYSWLYTYDGNANIIDVEDALHGHYVMTYGPRNERTMERNQDLKEWHYTYDVLARVETQTDPNGITRTLQYDAGGRLEEVDFSTGRVNWMLYDDNNNPLVIAREGSGPDTLTQFTFDSMDRLQSSRDAFGKTVRYSYDPRGSITNVLYPDGKPLAQSFDELGRLTNQVFQFSPTQRFTNTYAYDQADRLIRRTYPNGIVQTNAFDTANRLTGLSYFSLNPQPSTLNLALQYAYDWNGNKTKSVEQGTLEWPLPSLTDETARYTPSDRLIDRHVENNSVVSNQLSVISYAYDPSGNMTNATGAGQSWTLTYDEDNRTTSIHWQNGALNTVLITNRYDAVGRRISRTKDGMETRYTLDLASRMERILCDINSAGTITAWYIHGPDIAFRLDAGTNLTCYHSDAQANIIALTGANGTNLAQYAYTPYGRLLGSTNYLSTLNSQQYTFVGSQGAMEELPGLYFMRARYYSAEAGVFLSTDPVKHIGPTWRPSVYAYVNGNPLLYVDPSGLSLDRPDTFFVIGTWIVAGFLIALAAPEVATAVTVLSIANVILVSVAGVVGSMADSAAKAANQTYTHVSKADQTSSAQQQQTTQNSGSNRNQRNSLTDRTPQVVNNGDKVNDTTKTNPDQSSGQSGTTSGGTGSTGSGKNGGGSAPGQGGSPNTGNGGNNPPANGKQTTGGSGNDGAPKCGGGGSILVGPVGAICASVWRWVKRRKERKCKFSFMNDTRFNLWLVAVAVWLMAGMAVGQTALTNAYWEVWAGTVGVSGTNNGVGTNAQFKEPFGIAVDSKGNVFVADSGNNCIRKIDTNGVVSVYAGAIGQPGSVYGTSLINTRFNRPTGLAVDPSDNLIVCDAGGSTHIYLVLSNSIDRSYRGPGTFGDGFEGCAADRAGKQYLSETNYGGISRVVPGAASGTYFCTGLDRPTALATDVNTNLYISDWGARRLRVAAPSGTWSNYAFSGISGYDDGAASSAKIVQPYGVVMAGTNGIIVVDAGAHTIRQISPAMYVTTIGGRGGIPGTNGGVGTNALFNGPTSVAIGKNGELYVTDRYNHVIRRASARPAVSLESWGWARRESNFVLDANPRGSPPFAFQWYLENAPLGQATNSTLALSNISPTNAGAYSVVVTNAVGSGTSAPVQVVVYEPIVIGLEGSTNALRVYPGAAEGFTFQWYQGTNALPGRTASQCFFAPLNRADAGSYSVSVSNGISQATSPPISLLIASIDPFPGDPGSGILRLDAGTARSTNVQWYLDGSPLGSQTNLTLAATNLLEEASGIYSVAATDGASTNTLVFPRVGRFTDCDHDGVSDAFEIARGSNPFSADTDNDGLSDHDELLVYFTDPRRADTEGDGMPDAWEIQYGLTPSANDAGLDSDLDGLSNVEEFLYSRTNASGYALSPRAQFSTPTGLSDYQLVRGEKPPNLYSYDRLDRLVGAEYGNGFTIGYQYDGNGNILRQMTFNRFQSTDGLPALWKFLNGLNPTNSSGSNALYADADGDGWSNYQEWHAGTSPTSSTNQPDPLSLLGPAGSILASMTWPFSVSNFVVGVGQLDGVDGEEIVVGADGDPGATTNFLLVLSQKFGVWTNDRVEVGSVGVTSLAVGQVSNTTGIAIYFGTRSPSGGEIREARPGANWAVQTLATSSVAPPSVFGLGPYGDLVARLGPSGTNVQGVYSFSPWTNSWNRRLLSINAPNRGLGTVLRTDTGLALASAQEILVGDSGSHTIKKVTMSGQVSIVAGISGTPGTQDGPTNVAKFKQPEGVARDASGTIYVADYNNSWIRRIYTTNYVDHITNATLSNPLGITVGDDGTVYATEYFNSGLVKISPSGATSYLLGPFGSSYRFEHISYGPSKSLYVIRNGSTSGTVFQVNSQSTNTYFSNTTNVFAGSAFNLQGDLFLSDWTHSVVYKVEASGSWCVWAGSYGSSGINDGIGTEAKFSQPYGLACDRLGNVYVADYGNNRIRKIASDQTVTTLATNLSNPVGLWIDPAPLSSGLQLLDGGGIEVVSAGSGGNSGLLDEPANTNVLAWRGLSLRHERMRSSFTNLSSVIYCFVDDANANGRVDAGDDFCTAEYQINPTNNLSGSRLQPTSVGRERLKGVSLARTYGLAAARYTSQTNPVLFTAQPDGQLFSWVATNATGPLQRQVFSAQHQGKAWHALAAARTPDTGEALLGLRVDPAAPNRCDVVFWSPQPELWRQPDVPQTAPVASILPDIYKGGSISPVRIVLQDAEANPSTPFLQYSKTISPNWSNATIGSIDGWAYGRVAAAASGSLHTLFWNAGANLGAGYTNWVYLRVMAADVTLAGDWSVTVPYLVEIPSGTPTNIPPWITLDSPSNGARYLAGEPIVLDVSAVDVDGSISKVEFFADATKLGQVTTPPYRYVWSTAGVGTHTLFARATDNLGATTNSAAVSVQVYMQFFVIMPGAKGAPGTFWWQIAGNPGEKYQILTSTNLTTWSPLGSVVTNTGGTALFTDYITNKHRFYRAALVP
jgi:RHS repeat-associated protein